MREDFSVYLASSAETVPTEMFSVVGRTSVLPTRGILISLVFHLLFGWMTLYTRWDYWIPQSPRLITAESTIRQHDVLILPDLRPFEGPASRKSGERQGFREEASLHAPSSAPLNQRVAYMGPQTIASDPAHADNFIQDVQQPDLADPPKLPRPLPFPSMVELAPPSTMAAPVSKAEMPAIHSEQKVAVLLAPSTPPAEAPKLPVPETKAVSSPTRETAEKRSPAQSSASTRETHDGRNILIIDAIQLPPRNSLELPPGELSGGFVVSPNAIDAPHSAIPANTAPRIASSARGGGDTPHASTSAEPGGGRGGGANGSKLGNGNGIGIQTSGNSPFPTVVIQGGNSGTDRGTGASPGSRPRSYGLTIVANGSSGGGIKDYGIFRDEAAYTVYVDMSDAGAIGPSWTLQYALDTQTSGAASTGRTHALLIPPYLTMKELPRFPAETAKRNRGGTIIIFGVINLRGSFEGLRIMQGSDSSLNQLVIESLTRWIFHPAEIEGTTVAVKVLLGVPVNAMPLIE